MGKKHRRSWTPVRIGMARPETGYHAVIAHLESEKAATALVGFAEAVLTWALPILSFEPRYRVLVGRDGSVQQIGVREAFRFTTALEQLAEVDRVLAHADEAEVRRMFGVDF